MEGFAWLDQIPSQYSKVAVHRAVEFDFPIRRSDDGLAHEFACPAVIRALVTTSGARFVGTSVDVNHVGHYPNYALEIIESPEFCFGRRHDGTRSDLPPFFVPLIE